jgi:hypothetical protein
MQKRVTRKEIHTHKEDLQQDIFHNKEEKLMHDAYHIYSIFKKKQTKKDIREDVLS